jgi:hypothetical protein
MDSKFKLPTETVDLPSKGLLYPESSPLANGTVEMKYMTAKEEDILTNQNYITNGTVIDKLLKSLIVTPGVDFNSILVGDKNAIMVAARILAYGKDYEVEFNGERITVDLTQIENKEVDYSKFTNRTNEFTCSLLNSGNIVTFKILNHEDERLIEREIEGLQKINKENITGVTTRLKRIITSVNGNREQKDIREFVDGYLLAKDARVLREEYNKVSPDVDLKFKYTFANGVEEDVDLPIGINFFWPDA